MSIPNTDTSRSEALATVEKLKDDFVFFTLLLWQNIGSDLVAPIGKPEIQMLRWIGGIDSPNRRGILGPRGIGKTYLALAYTAWRLLRDPDIKVILASKTETNAKESLQLIRGWINSVPFLKHLQPRRSKGHRDTSKWFDVGPCAGRSSRSPSFAAVGIDGQLEGRRAHLIVGDDVETAVNTRSMAERIRLDERVRELTQICTYGDREIVYLGTYHHDDSVYLKLNGRGFAFRTWPVLYPTDAEMTDDRGEFRILNLAPDLAKNLKDGTAKHGSKVFPHRHTNKRIKELRAEGPRAWDMQQMLLIHSGGIERFPLRCEDLVVMDAVDKDIAPTEIIWGKRSSVMSRSNTIIDDLSCLGFGDDAFRMAAKIGENWSKYQGTVMWVDPSGKGSDRTGYACVGFLNGFLWVKAAGGLAGGYDNQALDEICRIAKANLTDTIVVEDAGGYGAVAPLLEARLRAFYELGQSTKPGGPLSGPTAVDAARRHIRDRWVDNWACRVETRPVGTRVHKEDRICDILEPPVAGHRIVIPRSLAEDQEFQLQFTRIQRVRGCLPHDDIIDALAGAVSYWQEELSMTPDMVQDQEIEDEITAAMDEMRTLSDSMSEGGVATMIQHR